MTTKPPLGRLEKVDLRNYWEREDTHFTPWLAQEESIRFLGEAIGLELAVEAQEQNVGPFRADILCKDIATDAWVLIENQLAKTDHGHLGQLLTYAAGLNAVTIVWIAQRFTDEHRATLDWLNTITDERFNFFGLEIELWQIGDSAAAPKFNVISKPNDWARTVTKEAGRIESTALTESKRIQLDFWTQFHEHMVQKRSSIKPTKPFPQHWMNMALGRAHFSLVAIAAFSYQESEEIRAEIVISGPNAKAYFALLEQQRDKLEALLGESLGWHNPESSQSCRLYLQQDVNLPDRAAWPKHFEWLRLKLEALQRVFAPVVKSLDLSTLDD